MKDEQRREKGTRTPAAPHRGYRHPICAEVLSEVKAGTTEKMKFLVLKKLLKQPRYAVIGILEGLWYMTAANAPDGAIGKFSDIEIAAWLEWEGEPSELINALVESRWLDRSPEHRLVVHDWHEHCPNYIKGNMKKHRRGFVTDVSQADTDAEDEAGYRESGDLPSYVLSNVLSAVPSNVLSSAPSTVPPSQVKSSQVKPSQEPSASGSELFESEPDPDSPVVHVLMPLCGGSGQFPITADMVTEYQETYPGVDVMRQLREMNLWLKANPAKRKTVKGAERFVVNWLSREQDKAAAKGIPQRSMYEHPPQRAPSRADRFFHALQAVDEGGDA